eukprot:9372824-Heterocapsa_arctica.AAC.1
MTTCHNNQCNNDLDDRTKFEWPPNPHGRMPQSAGSDVMYVIMMARRREKMPGLRLHGYIFVNIYM